MSASKPLEQAEIGLISADQACHLAEPARPLVVKARESKSFARNCRRITAQANTRPSLQGGPGGDEQGEAVRPSDRALPAPGSDASDRRTRHHGQGARESVQ